MLKLMTALSFAVFTLALIGSGSAQSSAAVGGLKFDLPAATVATMGETGRNVRLRAGEDDYPSPEGDNDDPDIRFPGDPKF